MILRTYSIPRPWFNCLVAMQICITAEFSHDLAVAYAFADTWHLGPFERSLWVLRYGLPHDGWPWTQLLFCEAKP